MHTAKCMPVVGGIHTIVFPRESTTEILVPPATVSLVVPFNMGQYSALIISAQQSQSVFFSNRVLTTYGVRPSDGKMWGVNTIFGAIRVIVPEQIRSLAFHNPSGLVGIRYQIWLEDLEPSQGVNESFPVHLIVDGDGA